MNGFLYEPVPNFPPFCAFYVFCMKTRCFEIGYILFLPPLIFSKEQKNSFPRIIIVFIIFQINIRSKVL